MEIIYLLLPASIFLAAIMVAFFVWAAGSGQFDDLDSSERLLHDEVDKVKDKDPLAASHSTASKGEELE